MKKELLPLKLSKRVEEALKEHRAVLALESTVLTHGLPIPQNFEVLRNLEEMSLAYGAEPATIIVLDGVAHIGLDEADILVLKTKLESGAEVLKLGRRDLPLAFSTGKSGGTTVSATMLLAYAAGIKVFATGGVGGVHRGWNNTLDISNDLLTLAEIPVIVVSAGCKAILDIPATLEYLETSGVPVLGWQTNNFPAFYSCESGYTIDRIDTAQALAAVYRTQQILDPILKGIILANPVPKDKEIPAEVINTHIDAANAEARNKGISGKALTPFLLAYLAKSTAGKSVETNLALLQNNVMVGAQIAQELK